MSGCYLNRSLHCFTVQQTENFAAVVIVLPSRYVNEGAPDDPNSSLCWVCYIELKLLFSVQLLKDPCTPVVGDHAVGHHSAGVVHHPDGHSTGKPCVVPAVESSLVRKLFGRHPKGVGHHPSGGRHPVRAFSF